MNDDDDLPKHAIDVGITLWPDIPDDSDIDEEASRQRFAALLKRRLAIRYPHARLRVKAVHTLNTTSTHFVNTGAWEGGVGYERGWRHDAGLEMDELGKVEEMFANLRDNPRQWIVRYDGR